MAQGAEWKVIHMSHSEKNAKEIISLLEREGILGGLKLSDQEILWCVTELVSKEDMDDTVRIAKEVIGA